MNEVWIFADWNKLNQAERDAIIEMNVTDVVLGVAMGPTQWNPTFTISQLIEHMQWITSNGMRAHLMIWLYRKEAYITDAARWLYDACQHLQSEQLPVSSILFDCEKHWHLGKHMRLDKAMSLITSEFAWAIDTPSLQLGVTGLAKLQPSVKPMLNLCDYGIGQGYAVWFPSSVTDKPHFSHSEKYEPGNPERIVHSTWEEFQPNKTIMGLACYFEKRPARYGLPAMSQKEALSQSLETTKKLGYTRCAYWSLNHCTGNSKAKQARRQFISKILANPNDAAQPNSKIGQRNYASLQWLLKKIGYDPGPIDGIYGPLTMAALNKFQANANYTPESGGSPTYLDLDKLVDYFINTPGRHCSGLPGMDHLIPPSNR